MNVEGNRARTSIGPREEAAAEILCGARDFIDRVSGPVREGSAPHAYVPIVGSLRAARQVVQTGCIEATAGHTGRRTMQAIAGAVAEHGAKAAVVGATLVAVTGATLTGGGALIALGGGIAGFLLLPAAARRVSDHAIAGLERLGHRIGLELRRRNDI